MLPCRVKLSYCAMTWCNHLNIKVSKTPRYMLGLTGGQIVLSPSLCQARFDDTTALCPPPHLDATLL